jgi:lysozyme
MIGFIMRAIAALFGRASTAEAVAAAPTYQAAATPTTVVLPSVPQPSVPAVVSALTPAGASPASPTVSAPAPAAPAASTPDQDPDAWLRLCTPLVEHFESCYLAAYPDPASPLAKALIARGLWMRTLGGAAIPADLRSLSGAPWTCGYGSTGPDVVMGTQWTQAFATARLERGLALCSAEIDGAVHVALSPAQKAALGSLLYNVGAGRAAHGSDPGRDGIVVLASGKPSTLLTKLNAGDTAGAADQILVWNRAGGAVTAGLKTRRAAERELFLTGEWQ